MMSGWMSEAAYFQDCCPRHALQIFGLHQTDAGSQPLISLDQLAEHSALWLGSDIKLKLVGEATQLVAHSTPRAPVFCPPGQLLAKLQCDPAHRLR